jgi:hypothetical protein
VAPIAPVWDSRLLVEEITAAVLMGAMGATYHFMTLHCLM